MISKINYNRKEYTEPNKRKQIFADAELLLLGLILWNERLDCFSVVVREVLSSWMSS